MATRRWYMWKGVGLVCSIYLGLNLIYAGKALLGIDLFPGHHGQLLPLGEWVWNRFRFRIVPLSFIGPYNEIGYRGVKGEASGKIAAGWNDNSTWSPVSVRYERNGLETDADPFCQAITVKKLGADGVWQCRQDVQVFPGKKYEISATARADRPMRFQAIIGQKIAPWHNYIVGASVLNQHWTTTSCIEYIPPSALVSGPYVFVLRSMDSGCVEIRSVHLFCLN